MHGHDNYFLNVDTGNTIVTAEIHQTFALPPEVSSRGKMSD